MYILKYINITKYLIYIYYTNKLYSYQILNTILYQFYHAMIIKFRLLTLFNTPVYCSNCLLLLLLLQRCVIIMIMMLFEMRQSYAKWGLLLLLLLLY